MTPDVDLAALVPADLPDGREVVQEGLALGKTIERGISMYCEQKGVRSERECREQAREQGLSSTCMNIGLATWADTREALGCIYEDALSRECGHPTASTSCSSGEWGCRRRCAPPRRRRPGR